MAVVEPRWLVRHDTTGQFLRQDWRTGKVLGWTRDPEGCRFYANKDEAVKELKRATLEWHASPIPAHVFR